MLTDPIADMLTRLRNASRAHLTHVSFSLSKIKLEIVRILQQAGYLSEVFIEGREIRVTLSYKMDRPVLSSLKRNSRPSRRVYVSAKEIPSIQNGLGLCILSTSKGVMEGEKARAMNVGGEILCEIW